MEVMTEKEKEIRDAPGVAPDGTFTQKIGNTTFEVSIFFNKQSELTAEELVKRLIRNKMEEGSF